MKILITDDHAVLRRGLKQILEDGFGKIQFGEAANASLGRSRFCALARTGAACILPP